MNRLTNEQQLRKRELAKRLQQKESRIREMIAEFNDRIEGLIEPLETQLKEYKTLTDEARDFAHDVRRQLQQHMDDAGDNYLDTREGEALQSLIGEWEDTNFQRFRRELPDKIEEPGGDGEDGDDELISGKTMADLPVEPKVE